MSPLPLRAMEVIMKTELKRFLMLLALKTAGRVCGRLREALAVSGETREQILAEAEECYLFTSDEDLNAEF